MVASIAPKQRDEQNKQCRRTDRMLKPFHLRQGLCVMSSERGGRGVGLPFAAVLGLLYSEQRLQCSRLSCVGSAEGVLHNVGSKVVQTLACLMGGHSIN
jgi:hypothetical protein